MITTDAVSGAIPPIARSFNRERAIVRGVGKTIAAIRSSGRGGSYGCSIAAQQIDRDTRDTGLAFILKTIAVCVIPNFIAQGGQLLVKGGEAFRLLLPRPRLRHPGRPCLAWPGTSV